MSLFGNRPLEVIGSEASRPWFSVGTAIRKHFPGRGSFDGVVVKLREPYYFVRYSDGDEEELDANEVNHGIKVFCEFYPEVRECTRFLARGCHRHNILRAHCILVFKGALFIRTPKKKKAVGASSSAPNSSPKGSKDYIVQRITSHDGHRRKWV